MKLKTNVFIMIYLFFIYLLLFLRGHQHGFLRFIGTLHKNKAFIGTDHHPLYKKIN